MSSGVKRRAHRVGIYGSGGIGKTSLAALAPKPRFIDIEGGTLDLDVPRVELPEGQDAWTWEAYIACLNNDALWDEYETVVIETGTQAEELASKYNLRTIKKNSQGDFATQIEDYGYGKGYTYLYSTFLLSMQAMERQWRRGKNVVVVMHDCTNRVPNPEGEDWIRYEPRLSDPTSGKGSIRLAMKEWLDHLVCVKYDVTTKDGKAKGHGSRMIYTAEQPWLMAKSRKLAEPVQFDSATDGTFWNLLLGKEA